MVIICFFLKNETFKKFIKKHYTLIIIMIFYFFFVIIFPASVLPYLHGMNRRKGLNNSNWIAF